MDGVREQSVAAVNDPSLYSDTLWRTNLASYLLDAKTLGQTLQQPRTVPADFAVVDPLFSNLGTELVDMSDDLAAGIDEVNGDLVKTSLDHFDRAQQLIKQIVEGISAVRQKYGGASVDLDRYLTVTPSVRPAPPPTSTPSPTLAAPTKALSRPSWTPVRSGPTVSPGPTTASLRIIPGLDPVHLTQRLSLSGWSCSGPSRMSTNAGEPFYLWDCSLTRSSDQTKSRMQAFGPESSTIDSLNVTVCRSSLPFDVAYAQTILNQVAAEPYQGSDTNQANAWIAAHTPALNQGPTYSVTLLLGDAQLRLTGSTQRRTLEVRSLFGH